MPLDRPITPRSLVDEAFDRIADAIVVGEIQPGERIREANLARQLGVSRGVLREAMQRLEGLKLVRRTSNVGVSVVGLSYDDLVELYVMRETLEGLAAGLCAVHMTERETATLETLLHRHGRSADLRSGDGYYQALADEDFHTAIARGSHNPRLEQMLRDELFRQMRLYRYRMSAPHGRARQAFEEHQAIVAAICERNPEKAERAMRTHLRNAREGLTWSDESRNIGPPGLRRVV